MKNKTIDVVGSELCTGCGTCAGVCPTGAIRMEICNGLYMPKIDDQICNKCGLCLRSCPGHSVDVEKLNLNVFGEKPANDFLGNYLACYMGYSKDNSVRHDSSSGGIVTQLLIFALEQGLIDGALVVRQKKDAPLEPEPFIARNRKEIISASKSKYCPVPANVAIREIVNQEGRFAVVGLPCQIQGIRKAESLERELANKIVLHMGLFCSHTVNFFGTEFLLEKLKIAKWDVKQLHYRGMGWPGCLSITLSNGHQVLVKYNDYWNPIFGSYFFAPLRCICCCDQTNELADLSFGDAWLKEVVNKDKEGTSIIISRNKIGEDLLANAHSQGVIALERTDPQKVLESQYCSLCSKKIGLGGRIRILKSLGVRTPNYGVIKCMANPFLFTTNLLQLLGIAISQKRITYNLLKYMPLSTLILWGAALYYFQLFSYNLSERSNRNNSRSKAIKPHITGASM